jgi:hemerythrin superfamily protein
MTELRQVDGTDVVDVLTADHQQALELIDEIRMTADADRLRDLADVLIAEIVRHSVAEETVVYPAMRVYIPNGAAEVDHDIAEHREIERTLKALEALDPEDAGFIRTVEQLEAELTHHATDEETEQFPTLRALVPLSDLIEMANQVEQIKSSAPTRPHPNAPNVPLFHRIAGPGVGLVDRLRDKLSDRPTSPSDLDIQ